MKKKENLGSGKGLIEILIEIKFSDALGDLSHAGV